MFENIKRTLSSFLPRFLAGSNYAGGYEAASTGRRLRTWGMANLGPNSFAMDSVAVLRNRSRELERNNELVSAGLDTLVANIVGQGVTPRWVLSDVNAKYRDQLQAWWQSFVQGCDFDGLCDFYGMQALAVRTMILSGECFGIFRWSDSKNPLKIQLLEPDYLDETYSDGLNIRYGIEFDAQGLPKNYFFWRNHPAEAVTQERLRIAASDVVHLFKPIRPGQRRGRPWLAQIILPLHELCQYNDAELVRKKTAAMFGGFILRQEFASPYNPPRMGEETEPNVVELEPGTFTELPPGYDVKMAEPADVGGQYDIFVKHQERRVARGMGLTYAQLTGDLADTNYSSIRAGNLEFQRHIKQLVYHVLVFRFCQPILSRALNAAVLSGVLDLPGYTDNPEQWQRVHWCIDGWEWVDPEKDVESEIKAIRAGLKSRSQAISEIGRDIEDVDAENAHDLANADRYNLIYDTTPRDVARNGALQGRVQAQGVQN